MMRASFSIAGGITLALLLFWLLALLVAPPQEEYDELEVQMSLSMVDMPDVPEVEVAEAAAELPPPPPPLPAAEPPPMPEPVLMMESPIALPEPELPTEEVVPLELDEALPELTEIEIPEPQPEPQPEPESQPRPEPTSQPAPAPSPEPAPVASAAQPAQAQAEPAPQTPMDVGQITPTRRVPPEYPTRAQRRGLEGYVELQFMIRPDGSVDRSSIQVVDASPRSVFDSAAQQAVANWQFEPADRLRRARQRLEFQLR
ncbi:MULTISPECIES: energy transducer TonB [Halomonadaceae]|uniref:energy transducer TonB n=1 Tax=Halomonadaceae TaxID=28256 RepID=UPI001598D760|nr:MULTISPECIES: energy transducer TonB [Halomonas]QJQ94735.1 TonB family protein [Halomonas sp. PA5]